MKENYEVSREGRQRGRFKSRDFRENFERIADSFSAKDEMFHSLRTLLTGCASFATRSLVLLSEGCITYLPELIHYFCEGQISLCFQKRRLPNV